MSGVSIKTEIGPVDGTPEKRMFWSIISDYDLKTGLCELIDNALDIWISGDKKKIQTIEIDLDVDQQLISVKDNVGGGQI
jgi:DNA gyrase/topoisomerase IV subunit B